MRGVKPIRRPQSRPLVLCYHAVSDAWTDTLAVPLVVLERQLRHLLRRRYVPASGLETARARGNLLHVTFDDAYRSVMTAVPALERLGVSSTVFACSSYADDGRPLAVPELAAEAAAHPDELATMRWDELRALAERGVEIGSHTATHPHLTQISDRELAQELEDSRERFETELRRPCRLLAYPYGEENPRVRRAARAAGYELAFGLGWTRGPVDVYAFPRVGIWRKDGLLRVTVKTLPLGAALSRLPTPTRGRPVPDRSRSA
jgi:peptidoglycan/xylan/chitin deacetylase (PgdA/CDA1 family)